MTQHEYWFGAYLTKGAYWMHDGNPRRPHVLHTGGMHSGAFFNSELLIEDPHLVDQATLSLYLKLNLQKFDFESVDRVVGPAMGAVTLAHDLARHIGVGRTRPCFRAYTEKSPDGLIFKKSSVKPGERILLIEDVLTTGSSLEVTAQAVERAGGIVLPFALALVNRSGEKSLFGKKTVSLIDVSLPATTPAECMLCKRGGVALPPKENWSLFIKQY